MPHKSKSLRYAASQQPSDGSKEPRRAFFGRRKGHALKPRQAALFDTLLPKLALDLGNPAPPDLRKLFASEVDSVRLEIGFGGAEHLISEAKAHPRIGFLGTDAFVNSIAKALVAINDSALANIRLFFGDASELIEPRDLPTPRIGDLVLLRDAGAYGASMSSNYNSLGRVPQVWWKDGRAVLMSRRETLDDILRTECEQPLE